MKLNQAWVQDQLVRSKTRQSVSTSVVRLMSVLETMNHTDDTLRETLDKFHQLALGHAVAQDDDEKWGPVVPGYYQIGDIVRVRLSAYDGDKGTKHNGKRGRVTAVRNGMAVVLYDDAPNNETMYHHHPHLLERLV